MRRHDLGPSSFFRSAEREELGQGTVLGHSRLRLRRSGSRASTCASPSGRAGPTAFPDSKAGISNALVGGNSVVLELTWKGTHKGQLQTPKGPVEATGKSIEIRAVAIMELSGERRSYNATTSTW